MEKPLALIKAILLVLLLLLVAKSQARPNIPCKSCEGSDGASNLARTCTCKSSVMEGNSVVQKSSKAREDPYAAEQPEDYGRNTPICLDKCDNEPVIVQKEVPDLDEMSNGEQVTEEKHEQVEVSKKMPDPGQVSKEMPDPGEVPEVIEELSLDRERSDMLIPEPIDTPRPGEEPESDTDETFSPPHGDLVGPTRSKLTYSQFEESICSVKPTEGGIQEANDHNIDKFEAPEDRNCTTTGNFTAEKKDHLTLRQQGCPANSRPVPQLLQKVQPNPAQLEVEVPSEEIAYNLVYFANLEINSPLENNAVKDFNTLAGPTSW